MNIEILEPLLLDRALGQLTPEVAALLESHLTYNAEAARRAAEIADTVTLAQAALAAPVAPPKRALDTARLREAHRARYALPRRLEIFRLAACLAIGLGLGWFARPLSAPVEAVAPTVAVGPLSGTQEKEPPVRFWSTGPTTPPAIASERRHRLPLGSRAPSSQPGGQL